MLNKDQIAFIYKLTKNMVEEITGEQTQVRVTAGGAMVLLKLRRHKTKKTSQRLKRIKRHKVV